MEEEGAQDPAVITLQMWPFVCFWQDQDEETAKFDKTVRGQSSSQPWDNDAVRVNPCSLIPTPNKEEDELVHAYPTFDPQGVIPSRASLLPVLNWAERGSLETLLQQHPLLQPKTRAILLDWLTEVRDVYKLHRKTFYLTQGFFDQCVATQENIVKTLVQLTGISSLFTAAKHEEIYSPKLHQFSCVTDRACPGDGIVTMELATMKACKWQLRFLYNILAVSALCHFFSSELIQKVSEYQWCDTEKCIKWIVPLAMVIEELGSSNLSTSLGWGRGRGRAGVRGGGQRLSCRHTDLYPQPSFARQSPSKESYMSEQNRVSPFPTGTPATSRTQRSAPDAAK
uniref:Cyclin-like domain-containing protein n=1 Tax=Oryctolagus cuniculus TaxID=9986 RepID=A0A5F9CST7_RABIT